jgi:hypothetical protein
VEDGVISCRNSAPHTRRAIMLDTAAGKLASILQEFVG